ncbi:MAG: LysM domain-containing protein [Chloroflexi bacterium]|nr:MAG: LysM domain-containing protein [Chloroflexota bacterium]
MDPNSALPSYRVYRGSLAALLIGSVFAIWLLVRPGAQGDFDGPPSALAAVLPSATATAQPTTSATASPRPSGSAVTSPNAAGPTGPAGSQAPAAAATSIASGASTASTPAPTPTGTPRPPTPTPTPAGPRTHIVKSGDTLYGLVDQYRGTVDFQTYSERLFQLNRMTEGSVIAVGDSIRIP